MGPGLRRDDGLPERHHLAPAARGGLFASSTAIAEATDAARLDLALGRPVLVVDSTDIDADGKPLVTKRSRFAAERVEFVVES